MHPSQAAPPKQDNYSNFARVVDTFYKKRAALILARNKVMASGDAQLIADYNSAIARATSMNSTIQNAVGVWSVARKKYASLTDTTSMAIGDAVDTIRSWFGYDPSQGLNGLGAIQLIPIAVAGGIAAAVIIVTKGIDEVLIRIEATKIQREDGVSRSEAIKRATNAYDDGFFKGAFDWKVIGGVAAIAWFLTRK